MEWAEGSRPIPAWVSDSDWQDTSSQPHTDPDAVAETSWWASAPWIVLAMLFAAMVTSAAAREFRRFRQGFHVDTLGMSGAAATAATANAAGIDHIALVTRNILYAVPVALRLSGQGVPVFVCQVPPWRSESERDEIASIVHLYAGFRERRRVTLVSIGPECESLVCRVQNIRLRERQTMEGARSYTDVALPGGAATFKSSFSGGDSDSPRSSVSSIGSELGPRRGVSPDCNNNRSDRSSDNESGGNNERGGDGSSDIDDGIGDGSSDIDDGIGDGSSDIDDGIGDGSSDDGIGDGSSDGLRLFGDDDEMPWRTRSVLVREVWNMEALARLRTGTDFVVTGSGGLVDKAGAWFGVARSEIPTPSALTQLPVWGPMLWWGSPLATALHSLAVGQGGLGSEADLPNQPTTVLPSARRKVE